MKKAIILSLLFLIHIKSNAQYLRESKLPLKAKDSREFMNGYSWVKTGKSWTMIDSLGNLRTEHVCEKVGRPIRSEMWVCGEKGYKNRYYIVHPSPTTKSEFILSSTSKKGTLDITTEDEKHTILHEDGHFSCIKNHLIVSSNNKWGLVDLNGTTIINYEYESLKAMDNYLIARTNNQYGILDFAGNWIVPPRYDNLEFGKSRNDDSGIYFKYEKNGLTGVLDLDKNIKIEGQCDDIRRDIDDRWVVKINEHYGCVNNEGEKIIPATYMALEFTHPDWFYYQKNDLVGISDLDGKIILDHLDGYTGYTGYTIGRANHFRDEYRVYTRNKKQPSTVIIPSNDIEGIEDFPKSAPTLK